MMNQPMPDRQTIAVLGNPRQMMKMLVGTGENLCSIVTVPLEFFLHPKFGSRCINPLTLFFNYGFMLLIGLGMGTAQTLRSSGQDFFSWDMTLAWALYLGATAYHLNRVCWLIQHPREEVNSYDAGPGLPFIAALPNASSWNWRRMVYEPLSILIPATVLGRLGIINPVLALALSLMALALSAKSVLLFYQAFEFARDLLDNRNSMPQVQAIADGKRVEGSIGAYPASAILVTPPEVRTQVAARMAGLTPEMASLITPVPSSRPAPANVRSGDADIDV